MAWITSPKCGPAPQNKAAFACIFRGRGTFCKVELAMRKGVKLTAAKTCRSRHPHPDSSPNAIFVQNSPFRSFIHNIFIIIHEYTWVFRAEKNCVFGIYRRPRVINSPGINQNLMEYRKFHYILDCNRGGVIVRRPMIQSVSILNCYRCHFSRMRNVRTTIHHLKKVQNRTRGLYLICKRGDPGLLDRCR